MIMVSLYSNLFLNYLFLYYPEQKKFSKNAVVSFFCINSLEAEMKSWGRMFGLYPLL